VESRKRGGGGSSAKLKRGVYDVTLFIQFRRGGKRMGGRAKKKPISISPMKKKAEGKIFFTVGGRRNGEEFPRPPNCERGGSVG